MERIKTPYLLSLSFTLLSAAPAARASAQYAGGALFSAQVHIGGVVTVGLQPPPPAVVYVQPVPPPPQVVYVQPAPPPPQVIYVQPAPAPVYVQRPAPVVIATASPIPAPTPQGNGLHGYIGGLAGRDVQMGGLTGAFRLRRPRGHFALDLGIGAYGGQDYNGLDRAEVPVTADLLLFLNPQDQFQLYGLAGLGFSFAHAEGDNARSGVYESQDYSYFGTEVGAGVELRLSEWFAVNADLRTFLRERIDQGSTPEFIDPEDPSRTTDTSAGAMFGIGATIYY